MKVFSVSCGVKSPLSASSTFFGAEVPKAQAVAKKKVIQKTKTLRNLLKLKGLELGGRPAALQDPDGQWFTIVFLAPESCCQCQLERIEFATLLFACLHATHSCVEMLAIAKLKRVFEFLF